MKFVIDSDLHCGEKGPKRKENVVDYISAAKPDVVILAGDLTDRGSNGDLSFEYQKDGCLKLVRHENELKGFKKYVLKPLDEKFDQVLLCGGNHDEYFVGNWFAIRSWFGGIKYPVVSFIADRHGSDIYIKKITKNEQTMVFVSLGKYPDARANEFIKKEFPKYENFKMVLFWHYNPGSGEKWWSAEEMKSFIDTIEPFRKSIVCMAVGHQHSSYVSEWNNYTIINGSGNGAAYICEYKAGVLTTKILS